MQQIGIRELRQNASEWLRRVEAGESFEVTARGRCVALLVPRPRGKLEERIASGKAVRGRGDFSKLPPPLPPLHGHPTASEALDEQREERL